VISHLLNFAATPAAGTYTARRVSGEEFGNLVRAAATQTTEPTTNRRRTWANLVLETRYEYGSAARGNRGRFSGVAVHRLVCEYVVGVTEGSTHAPGTVGYRHQIAGRPVLFSARPACGCTSGQYAGKPDDRLNAESVTCTKCRH